MKAVLITGGSRGIGRALVRAFADAGYAVAFTYNKSADAAAQLASETGALAILADSRREDDIAAAVSLAISKLGTLDILINNAAISSIKPFDTVSLDEWNDTFSVSVTGAFLYSKAVLSEMLKKKWGRIINISSIWGMVGASCEVHYSTAKAALIGFTKAMAKELSPSGITVNAIAPGVICTDMNSSLDEATLASLAEETPVGRLGRVEDVCHSALFLASSGSDYITGDVLNVSGGLVI